MLGGPSAFPTQGIAPDYSGAFYVGTEHPLATEIRSRYERYAAAQYEWSEEGAKDVEFVYGAHWTPAQAEALDAKGHIAASINSTFQLVDQAVSLLTANRPSFQTAAREASDAEASALRSNLLAWMWEQSGGNTVLKPSVFDAYVQGRGVLYVHVDPNEDFGRGEVRFSSLHPSEVFPDPNTTHLLWDDAQDVVVRRVMTYAQITAAWPQAEAILPGATPAATGDYPYGPTGGAMLHGQQLFPSQVLRDPSVPGHEQFEVLEHFSRVRVPHYRVTLPDPVQPGDAEIVAEQDLVAAMQRPTLLVQSQDGLRPVADRRAVAQLEQFLASLGPEAVMPDGSRAFHMAAPVLPGQVDPQTGGPMLGDPMPVPGPEPMGGGMEGLAMLGADASQVPIPGSTVLVTPSTVGEFVAMGVAQAKRFLRPMIRMTAAVGGRLLYAPVNLPTDRFPTVPIQFNHHRNPFPVSDVRLVRDLQLLVNKTNSLIVAHATNSTSLKVFYPDGSITDVEGLEQKWAQAGTALIPYDPQFNQITGQGTGGIVVAAPPPLPSSLYENTDRYLGLMREILGLFSLQQGDAQMAPQTFRGTIQVDEFAMRRIKSKMDAVYAALSRVGMVALDFAAAIYTEEKVARLVQPDGETVEMHMNALQYDDYGRLIGRINDITVGRYDVIVVAGSTLPSNRWALLEQYLQLFQAGIVDQEAVLKNAEIPDGAKILERAGMMRQMQQAIEQLQQQVKDLQGDNQTLQRETMHARQETEMAKFRANLKVEEARMQMAGQLFQGTLQQDATIHRTNLAADRQVQRAKDGAQGAATEGSGGTPASAPSAAPARDPFFPAAPVGPRPVSPYAA